MKLRSILILSLFACSLPLFGGAAKSDDEKAVMAVEKQWVNALLKNDAAALDKLLGDDLSYTHSSAKTETKADVLQVVKSGATKYDAIDLKNTKLRQYGSVVVATHDLTLKSAMSNKTNPGGVTKLYVTLVWAKQGSGWQLVSRQATKLPD
jgi:ketosteroid isomerase-like protein